MAEQKGKYGPEDLATSTPEAQGNTAVPEEMGGIEKLQHSFDENTTPNPNDPFLKTLLKSTAHTIGQPLVHPLDTLNEREKEMAGQPAPRVEGPTGFKIANTIGNTIGSTAALAGGAAAGEAGEGLLNKIPTRAKAGDIFNRIGEQLKDQPVNLTESAQPLQRVAELGERGGTLPTPANRFLQRSQMIEPLTYPEARDYQSNLSSLSREDEGMKGPMRGGVKQLNKAFYNDIKNAADAKGLGEDYANAMNMNRRAAQLNHAFKAGGKAAAAGAVGAGTYKLVKDLIP